MYEVHSNEGVFFIGDICYALTDEMYDGIYGTQGYKSGAYKVPYMDDVQFAVVDINSNSGVSSMSGTEYPIEASNIGIVPKELWNVSNPSELAQCGKIIRVPSKKLSIRFDEDESTVYISIGDTIIEEIYTNRIEEGKIWSIKC